VSAAESLTRARTSRATGDATLTRVPGAGTAHNGRRLASAAAC